MVVKIICFPSPLKLGASWVVPDTLITLETGAFRDCAPKFGVNPSKQILKIICNALIIRDLYKIHTMLLIIKQRLCKIGSETKINQLLKMTFLHRLFI